MNNEPVAWIIESDEEFKNGKNFPTLDWYVKDILNLPIGTKLYTHPVKELDEQFEKGFKAGKEEGWKAHKFHHPVKEQDVKYDVTVRWDDKITHHKNVSVDTPLHYTHPVKELTDEEILKIFYNIETPRTVSHHKNAIEFARAILRKAQE